MIRDILSGLCGAKRGVSGYNGLEEAVHTGCDI